MKSKNMKRLLLAHFRKSPIKVDHDEYYQNFWAEHKNGTITIKAGLRCYFISNPRADGSSRFCSVTQEDEDGFIGYDYFLGIDENGKVQGYQRNPGQVPNLMCKNKKEAIRRCYEDYKEFLKNEKL